MNPSVEKKEPLPETGLEKLPKKILFIDRDGTLIKEEPHNY